MIDKKLTDDFWLHEFACHGTYPPTGYIVNIAKLAEELQKIRDILRIPIVITSGYRTKSFNASLPNSSPVSQHLYGKAADLRVSIDPRELIFVVGRYTNIRRIGVGKGIFHVDIAEPKSGEYDIWYY
jgi:uncharacterized protein YcbK (DUF882 family)